MAKRKRPRCGTPTYWESDDFNSLTFYNNFQYLFSLALNRFRWVGLPETCDARFLEYTLHTYGIATVCHPEGMPDTWQSLQAVVQGPYNCYGLPTSWRGRGWDTTDYEVTPESGVLVWYAQSRYSNANSGGPWNTIYLFANKLTQYQRTEDVNLYNQRHTQVWVAPRKKRQELVNIVKQSSGFEPCVLGDEQLLALNEGNVFSLGIEEPVIIDKLAEAYQNTLNQYLSVMGIPNLAVEKSERLIKDEVNANNSAVNIALLDCLNARRKACEELKRLSPETFGDLGVYLNNDWESYNYNYTHLIQEQADDGVIDNVSEAMANATDTTDA